MKLLVFVVPAAGSGPVDRRGASVACGLVSVAAVSLQSRPGDFLGNQIPGSRSGPDSPRRHSCWSPSPPSTATAAAA